MSLYNNAVPKFTLEQDKVRKKSRLKLDDDCTTKLLITKNLRRKPEVFCLLSPYRVFANKIYRTYSAPRISRFSDVNPWALMGSINFISKNLAASIAIGGELS